MKHVTTKEPPIAKQRLILILGPPRVGKTTVIQKVLTLKKVRFGGFFTLAVNSANKRDFRLVTISALCKTVPCDNSYLLKRCDIPNTSIFNYEELENRGLHALNEASDADVIVIDELGTLQLQSSALLHFVNRLLDSTTPLVLTGATLPNPFFSRLAERADAIIFKVTLDNRSTLASTIIGHIKSLLAH